MTKKEKEIKKRESLAFAYGIQYCMDAYDKKIDPSKLKAPEAFEIGYNSNWGIKEEDAKKDANEAI